MRLVPQCGSGAFDDCCIEDFNDILFMQKGPTLRKLGQAIVERNLVGQFDFILDRSSSG